MRSLFLLSFLLAASQLTAANKLRVAVQLTETDSGAQIWTELHHRNYSSSNLFEVGDNIVSSIIDVIGDFNGIITLQSSLGFTKNKTGSPYLTTLSWYNSFYSRFNEEVFRKAYAAMDHAIEQNPSDELAWAFFAQLSLLAFLFEQDTREKDPPACC